MKKSTAIKITSVPPFGFAVIDLCRGMVSAYHAGHLGLSEIKGLSVVAAAVLLYFSTDDKAKRRRAKRTDEGGVSAPDLILSLEGGVLGGLLGGLVAGLPFALYYYFAAVAPTSLLTAIGAVIEIVVYAVIVGLIVGIAVQVFIYTFRKSFGSGAPNLKELAGGLAGGALAGLVVGLIGGSRFGLRETEKFTFEWLMGSASFGAGWIACGTILFTQTRNWWSAVRALAAVFAIAILAVGAGVVILEYAGIDLYDSTSPAMALKIGAEIGVICGAVMGLQVAGTQVVYRLLDLRSGKAHVPAKVRKHRK
jgi:hypothetical protein